MLLHAHVQSHTVLRLILLKANMQAICVEKGYFEFREGKR